MSAPADERPDDRAYLAFIAAALAVATLGAFPLATIVTHAGLALFWTDRFPRLVQAHGWAQLEGWAGLFIAGMAFRLLPRFAGVPTPPRVVTHAAFVLLTGGVVLRTVGQVAAGGDGAVVLVVAGQLLWAAGGLVFAAATVTVAASGRQRRAPWRAFALAGGVAWAGWAVASVAAGLRAAGEDGHVPTSLDEPLTWFVMLGAIGNFIWAVQSRTVPIFFGRKAPALRATAGQALLLNAGILLLFAALWQDGTAGARLEAAGLALAGLALVLLAPLAGSVWGRATRLRPRAQGAVRFVLLANRFAVLAGLLLIWAGVESFLDGRFAAPGLRDAARHAFGLGVITCLIVGMAQLVAPIFALRRAEPPGPWLLEQAPFWLLTSGAVLRVGAGLFWDQLGFASRMRLAGVAGTLAWLGLVLFAVTVLRALSREGRTKESLAAAVRRRGDG